VRVNRAVCLCVTLALLSMLGGCFARPSRVITVEPDIEVVHRRPVIPPRPAWDQPITDANFTALVDLYHPNELGRVLILEYHQFGDKEERWMRRWDNFRQDLQTLYAKGYRAVNLLDYLNDTMHLPPGTSPVIFTFDDSSPSQMKLVKEHETWEADPQSAVGIMLQFAREHPDFGAAGTFYVNFTPVPFHDEATWAEAIRFLVDHGFEIANHTLYHEQLDTLSDEGVQKTLAGQVKRIRDVIPTYDGSTMALPFGIWPKNKGLAIQGEFDGVRYQHRAVLLVGADPVFSQYDARVDRMALPRVQAIDSEFARWFPYLETHRYVSDGDPQTVVIPEAEQAHLRADVAAAKRVRTYP
jgi:hypothetical protein